jgi:hypothetical protein
MKAGVITGTFRRTTGAHGSVSFTDRAPLEPEARPARAARMLAVAYTIAEVLGQEGTHSRGELAKALSVSEARLSQLLDLVLLAPDIQEELLFLEVPPGHDPFPERALRRVVRALDWREQRCRFARLRESGGRGTRNQPAGAPASEAVPLDRRRGASGARARRRGSRNGAARPPG